MELKKGSELQVGDVIDFVVDWLPITAFDRHDSPTFASRIARAGRQAISVPDDQCIWVWSEGEGTGDSESRFQTPEELDAQFVDPDGDGGGGGRRHGIGPATVLIALAGIGFRGSITPRCLQHLVEMAIDRGIPWMLQQVEDDPGLTKLPSAKWWFCKAMLIQADDPQLRRCRRRREPAHRKLPAEPINLVLDVYSISQVALTLADRFGTNPESESRQLHRIRSGRTKTVSERTADRIATGLGLHLLDLWPSWR